MDELLKQMSLSSSDLTSTFTIVEVMGTLALSFFLLLVMGVVYRITHQGVSYSKSFVHSMIIVGVTISMIMLLIGSNLARAFSLVGALSIIRFRNPVKDSRDVSFIFAAMGVGMACGTRFYLVAIVFTVVISAIVYFLHRFDVGAKELRELLLRIHVPDQFDFEKSFKDIFYQSLVEYRLISVDAIRDGKEKELIYTIVPRKGLHEYELLERLSAVNPSGRVSLLTGQQNTLL